MTWRWGRIAAGLVLAGSLVLAPTRAEAQGREENGNAVAEGVGARAVAVGHEGVEYYEAGNWILALERFREADSLYHSPVFVLYSARSLRHMGRLIEARELYRRVVAEEIGETTPPAFTRAVRDAKAELAAVEAEIPCITIIVTDSDENTSVTLNGDPIPTGTPIERDPGEFEIVVTDGEHRRTQQLTLLAADTNRVVELTLKPPTVPPPVASPPLTTDPLTTEQEPPQLQQQRRKTKRRLALVAAGGGTLLAGGVVGTLALAKRNQTKNNLPESCVDNLCPRSKEGQIEDDLATAKRLGYTADALFVAGAVVTVVGGSLWLGSRAKERNLAFQVGPSSATFAVRF